jgi:hypothetical protein
MPFFSNNQRVDAVENKENGHEREALLRVCSDEPRWKELRLA